MDDDQIRQLALACFVPGFVGPVPPPWLLDGLAMGLGGLILFGSNLGDGSRVADLTGQLRAAAGRDLVLGLDEEGGDVTRLDTVRGSSAPGAAALGYLDDAATTEEIYAAIGVRLAEAGVTMNLAPVADVNVDPRNPVIGVRSFSADPTVAARQVAAAVRGTQRAGVAACVKHFPGHGATVDDSHHEVATVDRPLAALRAVEFAPFAAVATTARAIMTGHLLVPALDTEVATVSRPVTTGWLRERLGFTGTIVTDALEMKAVSATVGMVEGFVRALIAGADTIESGALDYPELLDQIPKAVLQAVHDERLTAERLADAAARTAQLARPGDPAARYEPQPDVGGRCLEIRGELPRLSRPLVVECRTPNGMASGALPWSVADRIAARVPGTDSRLIGGAVDSGELSAEADGRTLVLVVRDPGRNPWQRSVLDAGMGHPSCVVVDVGWPSELTGGAAELPLVRTRGISPVLLDAAADVLTSGP